MWKKGGVENKKRKLKPQICNQKRSKILLKIYLWRTLLILRRTKCEDLFQNVKNFTRYLLIFFFFFWLCVNSSPDLRDISKPWVICLITFFSFLMYFYYFKNAWGQRFSYFFESRINSDYYQRSLIGVCLYHGNL